MSMERSERQVEFVLYYKDPIEGDYETEYLDDDFEWVKAGWNFIETLIISKGFPSPLYWFRTRSNPHRDNYH